MTDKHLILLKYNCKDCNLDMYLPVEYGEMDFVTCANCISGKVDYKTTVNVEIVGEQNDRPKQEVK